MEGPVGHNDVNSVLFACVVYDLPARHKGRTEIKNVQLLGIPDQVGSISLEITYHAPPTQAPSYERFLLRFLGGTRDWKHSECCSTDTMGFPIRCSVPG